MTWFRKSSGWLLAILLGLPIIHLNLVMKADYGSLLGSSFVYWVAIASMLWPRRDKLKLNAGMLSTVLGLLILSLSLVKSSFVQGYDPFLRLFPFLSAVGLGLLASGLTGLKQFWKELGILILLVPPPSALERLIDTTVVTAKFSTTLLWYSGFDVSRDGVFILIPNGGVEVYSGCSGIDTMLHMLGLSIVFLALFPARRKQRALLPLVSILIAFVVNGFRVGLMALLSEPVNKVAFEYWHKGDGSLFFSILSVMLLGIYCYFILDPNISTPSNTPPANIHGRKA